MRKSLSLILTVLLAAALAAGIWYSTSQASVKEVRGLVGSEKEAFFADAGVQAALKKHKLRVSVVKAGSREIASADLSGYDFAFPAGASSASVLKGRAGATQVYDAFYTPMVVASWQPIVKILAENGLAEQGADGMNTLDLRAFLSVMESGQRWNDFNNAEAYPSNRSVLLGTTDVRKSNSAAMYLALVAYLMNGESPPLAADITALAPRVSPLFLRQGYQENSSAGPFEDYLALGAGKAPLVVIYESQYLEQAQKGRLPAGSTLLYLRPTVYAKHALVPITESGDALGKALTEDPELQRLAAQYGFRTPDPQIFREVVSAAGITAPDTLVDVAQEPSQEVVNALIENIEGQYP